MSGCAWSKILRFVLVRFAEGPPVSQVVIMVINPMVKREIPLVAPLGASGGGFSS